MNLVFNVIMIGSTNIFNLKCCFPLLGKKVYSDEVNYGSVYYYYPI